jgi:hypothetical protein
MPPKLPISESVRALKVARAISFIRSTAAFAAAIETPASLYVMGLVIGKAVSNQPSAISY